MSFVSYAQNFEDVMLWRALKHVSQGFYIDVGANSPDDDSVTRAFYEHGWRGINIEPNPEFTRQLQQRRPYDRNVQVAVGDREDVLVLNVLGNSGLSTLDDSIAEKHVQAGWSVERQEVPVTTLAMIWKRYVPVGQDVHFLKVDVEGFEEAVLRGNDWSMYRPWVVVVEATLPMTQVESYEASEQILLAANYRFAYADGLNRFYVAAEHAELLPAFQYPPNVFDDFVRWHQFHAESRAAAAEAELAATRKGFADVERVAEIRQQQLEASQKQIEALLNSTSWTVTAPLRWAISAPRNLAPGALRSRVKIVLQHAALYVGRRPRLKRAALFALDRLPGVKSLLFRTITGMRPHAIRRQNVPTEIAHLTPRGRQIYAAVKAAIKNRSRENV